MDGPWQVGQKSDVEYGRLANETAKAMRLLARVVSDETALDRGRAAWRLAPLSWNVIRLRRTAR